MKQGFFTRADLARRWGVTRQAVHKNIKNHSDFPRAAFLVDNGRTEIFALKDVERYERGRGITPAE